MKSSFGDKIFKYRYVGALLFVVFCVIFNLNGSSISEWGRFISLPEKAGPVFGESRLFRSDEWACYTPMIFSQSFGETPWNAVNHIIRGTATDTAVVYGLPAANFFSILFRPFLDGFLVFGRERGLAFFYSARLAVLFLVWVELFLLICDGGRVLSAVGACFVAFAPVVQWWFAINGLAEMLIFGAGAVVLSYRYQKATGIGKKAACLLGIIICAGGYAMTLYPAWMIPLFWLFLGLEIWIIVEAEKKPVQREDIILISAAVLIFAGLMALYLFRHMDTIQTVLNTAYPGKRLSKGGGGLKYIFWQFGDLFYAFREENVPINICESAVVLDFFPLGIVLAGWGMLKNKKTDPLNICMLLYLLIVGWYGVFGMPECLAKITFLSRSTTSRVMQVAGFANLILLFRSVSKYKPEVKAWAAIFITAGYSAVSLLLGKKFSGEYLTAHKLIVLFPIYAAAVFGLLQTKKMRNTASAGLAVLAFFAGAFVNPIQVGDAGLYSSEIGKAISEITAADPDAIWMTDEMGFPYNNLPIIFGARTMNSTNVYPNLKLWKALDENGENDLIYNRYAHITASISNPSENIPHFQSIGIEDQFRLNLSTNEAKEIAEVKYILSQRDNLEEYSTEAVPVTEICSCNQFFIYSLG